MSVPSSRIFMPMVLDVIGDIHGHTHHLEDLLRLLGYEKRHGAYRSPETGRLAVFVGDFIDRGPDIPGTLEIVRRMVDAGAANAVIGNHEYNALCFHSRRETANGPRWLRSRSDTHLFQHLDTLYQFRNDRASLREYLRWFRTLPLFLEFGRVRVVHAAWDEEAIRIVSRDGTMTDEFLDRSVTPGSDEFRAVETLLKGVEVHLPEGVTFLDKDGHSRSATRVAWWQPPRPTTYREVSFPPGTVASSADIPVPESALARIPGYSGDVPVFMGHYWLHAERPSVQSRVVCVTDYSVAAGGFLAAYTWRGESRLTDSHWTWTPSGG